MTKEPTNDEELGYKLAMSSMKIIMEKLTNLEAATKQGMDNDLKISVASKALTDIVLGHTKAIDELRAEIKTLVSESKNH